MVHKAPAQKKKQQKGGIDFKKIRRKIGRKLPPPNNVTNTEIKSKAIILPEQSVASDKTGLAVSKKGLTLKELLQQTSHHNHKIRKDALLGIRDLILNHPVELRLHKYALIEKLRERISDDDKVVRETVYQLFKTVIFPRSKEDNQGILVSSMMAHIFCAMTHLEIDIRLMAFNFLDLLLQNYPSCFSTYAEEVLQNYEGILRNKKFYVQEKGKLKHALAGLLHCLSLLPDDVSETEQFNKCDSFGKEVLHAFEPQAQKGYTGFVHIMKKLKDLVPTLVNCFQELTPSAQSVELLDVQSFDCMLYMLQSIDRAVRFLSYGSKTFQHDIKSPVFLGKDYNVASQDEILPLLSKKIFAIFPLCQSNYESGKDDDRYFILNVAITEIFLHISESVQLPDDLLDRFLEFIEHGLYPEKIGAVQSRKKSREKPLLLLLNSVPRLVFHVGSSWKRCLLEAFTAAFRSCHPESDMKLACLSAIKEMLVSSCAISTYTSDPDMLRYHITWMRELPCLLLQLGEKYPSACQTLLQLQLRIGHYAPLDSSVALEYDKMLYSLVEFYSTSSDGIIQYGPFTRLSMDLQELSVSCLYYVSDIKPCLLESVFACCLCRDLDSSIVHRIIEIIQSAYGSGHVQSGDYISFCISLLSRYKVVPDTIVHGKEKDSITSNRGCFKSLTNVICSCLSQLGDPLLVLQMLENAILGEMSGGSLCIDNTCALLRVLMTLDSSPTKLSEESITKISKILAEYLVDVARKLPLDADESSGSSHMSELQYYFVPSLLLFHRSQKIRSLVLSTMGLMITDDSHNSSAAELSSRISTIVSVLLVINRNNKFHRSLGSCKTEIDSMIHMISELQSLEQVTASLEDRHNIQCSADRLKLLRKRLC